MSLNISRRQGVMLLAAFFSLFLTIACGKSESEGDDNGGRGTVHERKSAAPVDGIRVAWDLTSFQYLAPRQGRTLSYAGYPRVRRLNDGTHAAVYEADGNAEIIFSRDNGVSWSSPKVIFSKHRVGSTDVNISNPELVQLQNGDLVAASNYRPVKEEITPFAIAVTRSTDMGATWSPTEVIYNAGPRFRDGCWEPSFLQLPSGVLQIYFANETPYTSSDEQEISMLSSTDNGATWTRNTRKVSFRAGRRDGMPVPILLDDEIIMAIEDNKIAEFKPYIIRGSVGDNWSSPVSGDSPGREYALDPPLPDNVYAGAPYIVRVPTGEVLLSYQTTNGRSSDWELSTMEVAIGDRTGRYFTKRSQPFRIKPDKQAKWSSISLWDDKTVVAASATDAGLRTIGAAMILGHIIPELKAGKGETTASWDDIEIFVGYNPVTKLIAAVGYGEGNIYVSARVKDAYLRSAGEDFTKADGVALYIDRENYSLTAPDYGLFRIWCNHLGGSIVYEGDKGEWKEIQAANIQCRASRTSDGYDLLYTIPLASISKNDSSPIRINLELKDFDSESSHTTETVVNSNVNSSDTWLKVGLQ